MDDITLFFRVVAEMIDTILFSGLYVGYGGMPLSWAIAVVFLWFSPHCVAFCLLAGLFYYFVPKLKKRC